MNDIDYTNSHVYNVNGKVPDKDEPHFNEILYDARVPAIIINHKGE